MSEMSDAWAKFALEDMRSEMLKKVYKHRALHNLKQAIRFWFLSLRDKWDGEGDWYGSAIIVGLRRYGPPKAAKVAPDLHD